MSFDPGFKPKFRGIFNRDPNARVLEQVIQWHHERRDGSYNFDNEEKPQPAAESSEQAKQRKASAAQKVAPRSDIDKDEDNSTRKGDIKTRFIFRYWPRDPHGPYADLIPGKIIGNGVKSWGASLLDFYRMRTIPQTAYIEKLSSGSRIAAWCRANNELDWAKEELAWEEEEAVPLEQHPFDIATLISDNDYLLSKGFLPVKPLPRPPDGMEVDPTFKVSTD